MISRAHKLLTQAVHSCLSALQGNPMTIFGGIEDHGTTLEQTNILHQQFIYTDLYDRTGKMERILYDIYVTVEVKETVLPK